MTITAAMRMISESEAGLLRKFATNFAWAGVRASLAHRSRLVRGEFFPPFLFLSLTDRCNLTCRGCWVSTGRPRDLTFEVADRVIGAARLKGSRFFGLLGGEPLLYDRLFDLIAKHPDCYFQVFTNGTLLTPSHVREMRRLKNVTPLISIEGLEKESDVRRGATGVYEAAMEALKLCRQARLITGVATSVCRTNISEVATEAFIEDMAGRGAHYLWYYIFRPVGPMPSAELALEGREIRMLREFIVDARRRSPLFIIDAYWDHLGRAVCPAAAGMSHHVNAAGDVEPCPPVQFACDSLAGGAAVAEVFQRSGFLRRFRNMASRATSGCILMEDPAALERFLASEGARDTSARGTALDELSQMCPRPSHNINGESIPEKSLLYRVAKKQWFFGMGAYG